MEMFIIAGFGWSRTTITTTGLDIQLAETIECNSFLSLVLFSPGLTSCVCVCLCV